jgi:hypothetical protein
MTLRDSEIGLIIPGQPLASRFGPEQYEPCEIRQIDALVEDQRREHSAIGEKGAAMALRQVLTISGFGHLRLPFLMTLISRVLAATHACLVTSASLEVEIGRRECAIANQLPIN